MEGRRPPTTVVCWCQKTRVIALSCGIKISAVHCLVLSQSTRVADKQTDGRTDRQTQLRQLIPRYHSCSSSKNRSTFSVCCLKHIGAGTERAKNLASGSGAVSGCEKNWLEREREAAERGTERGSEVTEIGLSGERKFCRSRSAHMLCFSVQSSPCFRNVLCFSFEIGKIEVPVKYRLHATVA